MNKCDFCDYRDELKFNPWYSRQICALQENDIQREIECKKAQSKLDNILRGMDYECNKTW